MSDEKTDLQKQAESKQRKRLTISYMNTDEASATIQSFKEEAKKFSDDYVATLQHLLETSQPNLAEALLYGEVQELKERIASLENQKSQPEKAGPKTFGRRENE